MDDRVWCVPDPKYAAEMCVCYQDIKPGETFTHDQLGIQELKADQVYACRRCRMIYIKSDPVRRLPTVSPAAQADEQEENQRVLLAGLGQQDPKLVPAFSRLNRMGK